MPTSPIPFDGDPYFDINVPGFTELGLATPASTNILAIATVLQP